MLLAKDNYAQYGIEEQLPEPKRKVKIKKRKKFKLNPAFVVSMGLVSVFCLGLLLASQYARLATTGYDIVSMKKDLADLQTANERLVSQYNQLQSLDRVEKIATTKLGMVPPTTEGFIYVPVESKNDKRGIGPDRVQKSSSISRVSSKAKETYFERITNFVKNWTVSINQAEGKSLN